MSFNFGLNPKPFLISKGISYQILFSYKEDSNKQVFKALRKDDKEEVKQEVLLKVFLKEKKNYQKEFESLSQVISPYCVRLLGFENFSGKKALVLEYIQGLSLSRLVENFSLTEREIKYIITSIYRGLLDLKQQGFCHGDLSLDNVLIDEKAHIKLIDFGQANYSEEGFHGTVPFIAPEVLQGVKPNFLSDLFSLGILLAVFKTPYSFSVLKNMEFKDFKFPNSLMELDPIKRTFPYDLRENTSKKDIKSLSYKVKELLFMMKSKNCSTFKKLKPRKLPFFSPVRFLILFFLCFLTTSSSQAVHSIYGVLKVYTNQWLFVSIGSFQAYSPFYLPLKEGWYKVFWKDQNRKGTKRIFIHRGQNLLLQDENFYKKRF